MWQGYFTDEQWHRLAAPLAPEIVAVLRAAREWNRADLASNKTDLPLMSAVDAWLAANTPGLPPEKEEQMRMKVKGADRIVSVHYLSSGPWLGVISPKDCTGTGTYLTPAEARRVAAALVREAGKAEKKGRK